MSAQKRLSQLSLAAVALLVVATPSFAQSETNAAETEKTSAASVTDPGSVVAVNRESVTRELRTEVKSADTKAPKLSADMFLKAANESSSVGPKPSFEPVAVPDRFERKQDPVNGVTFVLSRGQKLPE
jgi:hypothetical protein